MLGTKQVGHNERHDSQHHGNRNVTCHVSAAGEHHYQTQQVHEEYEHKHCQKIGSEFRGLILKGSLYDTDIDEFDQGFERAQTLARGFERIFLMPAGKHHRTP